MESITEDAPADSSRRKLLIAIDDNESCERALDWAMSNMYRESDEVHLIHVIPRMQQVATYGAPPVDFLPQQDPDSYEQLVTQAQQFVQERFLPKLVGVKPQPVVHIIKGDMDSESIGNTLCKKAESLPAVAVVMASQGKSRFQEFFLGSVTNYVTHNCRKPVLVVH